MQALGDFIRRRRKQLFLSAEEVARRANCAATTIRNIEAGHRDVTLGVLGDVADALGVSVATLARIAGREGAEQ